MGPAGQRGEIASGKFQIEGEASIADRRLEKWYIETNGTELAGWMLVGLHRPVTTSTRLTETSQPALTIKKAGECGEEYIW